MRKHKTIDVVYISGKITGCKDLNKPKFKAAESLIRSSYNTHFGNEHALFIINPHDLPDTHHNKSWGAYMKECIRALVDCNKIFVLDDWKQSRGALAEVLFAKIMDIDMYEVDTMRKFEISYFTLLSKMLFKY